MASYSESVAKIEPGDLVALFTDGLTEAEDSDEEEFGVERVAEVVAELAEPTAEKLCDAILGAVEAFTEGATLHDDATLLVVERSAERQLRKEPSLAQRPPPTRLNPQMTQIRRITTGPRVDICVICVICGQIPGYGAAGSVHHPDVNDEPAALAILRRGSR